MSCLKTVFRGFANLHTILNLPSVKLDWGVVGILMMSFIIRICDVCFTRHIPEYMHIVF